MSKILILAGLLFLSVSSVYAQTADDYYSLGMANVKKNNLPQAISDFTMAIEIRPDYATAYYARAYAYYGMKDYNKALADVHETQKLGITVDPVFIAALEKPQDEKPAGDKPKKRNS